MNDIFHGLVSPSPVYNVSSLQPFVFVFLCVFTPLSKVCVFWSKAKSICQQFEQIWYTCCSVLGSKYWVPTYICTYVHTVRSVHTLPLDHTVHTVWNAYTVRTVHTVHTVPYNTVPYCTRTKRTQYAIGTRYWAIGNTQTSNKKNPCSEALC